jgi:hypothetical protein
MHQRCLFWDGQKLYILFHLRSFAARFLYTEVCFGKIWRTIYIPSCEQQPLGFHKVKMLVFEGERGPHVFWLCRSIPEFTYIIEVCFWGLWMIAVIPLVQRNIVYDEDEESCIPSLCRATPRFPHTVVICFGWRNRCIWAGEHLPNSPND